MQKFKARRYLIQLGIGLLIALFSSIWVNLLTSSLPGSNWLNTILNLGWSHLWLLLSVLLILFQVSLIRFWRRTDKKYYEIISEKYKSLEIEMIQAILKLAVEGIRALRRNTKINARYYYPSTIDCGMVLFKHRKIHVETVYMPDEYGLDYAIVDEDNLVICESFKLKKVLYSELAENHIGDYSERLSSQIDPNQKWVLCCPILDDDPLKEPVAMIVFYSTVLIAQNNEQILSLKQVAIDAAKSISDVLKMRYMIANEATSI